jgi:hypothetical protein
VITPKPEVRGAGSRPNSRARALNLVNGGVIVLDADQRIVLWNSWLTPRCGRAAARVMGHPLFDVFPELRGSRVEAAVLAALARRYRHRHPAIRGPQPVPAARRRQPSTAR